MSEELLRLDSVSKRFGSLVAIENLSLTINSGEIVALLGDNGAGKSTLIKSISGVYQFNGGDVYFRGKPVSIETTRDAIGLGIETIHQDSSLAPDLTVANNLFLGREPLKLPWLGGLSPVDRKTMQKQARDLLQKAGIMKKIDPDTIVGSLSGGERQAIAIARAMYFSSELIILDEPTNNLGVEETHAVLKFIRGAKASGHGCIYITHSLHHVFDVADRIVVMRRGKIVADVPRADTDQEQIERVIMGLVS